MLDKEFITLLVKLIIFLPIVLFSIYIILKLGGNKLQNIKSGRYINILEKVQISKDNSLLVVKMGKKGYVISNTNNEIKIMMEIDENELVALENHNKIPKLNSLSDLQKIFKQKEE